MKRWFWWVVGYIAAITALRSLLYILGDPHAFNVPFRDKYIAHLGLVRLHGVSASMALVLGPVQFMRRRPWHRAIGVTYLMAVALGAVSGYQMGLMAYGGGVSQLAFCSFALVWLWTAWRAWRSAVAHRFNEHEHWMLRNYALTFGAVLLRVELSALAMFDLPTDAFYPVVSWLGFLPCLLAAEVYLWARLRRVTA